MAFQIKVRRDSAADWISANSTLGAGEFGLETDTEKLKIGDGSTAWNDLQYITGDDATALTLIVQGSSYGYTTGGTSNPAGSINSTQSLTQILQFSFTSDGNATDIGDINPAVPLGRVASSSQTSSTHGYQSGGLYHPPTTLGTNNIQKWSFSSPYDGSDIGDLTVPVFRPYGSSSPTDGYSSGGRGGSPLSAQNVHDKFPFASDGNASDVGDLTVAKYTAGGNSSDVASYIAGGTNGSLYNVIEKIPFASGGTATDVGDLLSTHTDGGNANTTEYGYVVGGSNGGYTEANLNVIQRFSYSSDGNSTDYADLANGVHSNAGCSSTSHGYSTGGTSSPAATPPGAAINVIQKFPFSTASNATDVGDLTSILTHHSGNQN